MIRNMMVDMDHKTGTVVGVGFIGCSLDGCWFTPDKIMDMVEEAGKVEELRKEVKRLKDIDAAMKDFDLKKERKQLDDLAREGFEQVLKSRRGNEAST